MHHDAAIIKQRLPISAVLRAHGLEPRAGRMPCPLHDGDNPQGFSIKPGDQYARCWACGWHGDAIALEQALGGGTFRDAIRRCAALAGLREPKPWERKPWLDRQRLREERQRERWAQLHRWWQWDRLRVLSAAIADAHAEVAAAGALLATHPEEPVAWAWLERAVMARDQAEWEPVAEQWEESWLACRG